MKMFDSMSGSLYHTKKKFYYKNLLRINGYELCTSGKYPRTGVLPEKSSPHSTTVKNTLSW